MHVCVYIYIYIYIHTHIYIYEQIYFKELACVIVEAKKFTSAEGWRSREELVYQFKYGVICCTSPLTWGWSVFCSIKAFNLYDEAHPQYGGQSAFLKVY